MTKKTVLITSLFFISPLVDLLGCASQNPQLTSLKKANEYRQIIEKQKASADAQIDKKLPPLTSEGLEQLGDRYLVQGKSELAFKQYYEALKLNPEQERLRYKIGRLFLEKGLTEEARQEFQEILKKDANHPLAYEGMGRAFFISRDYAEAKINFMQALKLNPKLWEAHNFLGIIFDRDGRSEEHTSE